MDELKVWLKLLLRPLIVVAVMELGIYIWACWHEHRIIVPWVYPLMVVERTRIGFLTGAYWFLFVIFGGDDLWDATGKLLDRLPPGFQTIRAKIRKYNDS